MVFLLPNPSQETISQLTELLFNFIEGSKYDKIKRVVVCATPCTRRPQYGKF